MTPPVRRLAAGLAFALDFVFALALGLAFALATRFAGLRFGAARRGDCFWERLGFTVG